MFAETFSKSPGGKWPCNSAAVASGDLIFSPVRCGLTKGTICHLKEDTSSMRKGVMNTCAGVNPGFSGGNSEVWSLS